MGTQIRLAVMCIASLLFGGCAEHGWKPQSAPPIGFEAHNPCAVLPVVHHLAPRYPRAAAAFEQEGWVALKYHVAANGAVFNVRVVASSPEGIFDEASVAALARSRYAPVAYPVSNCSQVDRYSLTLASAERR